MLGPGQVAIVPLTFLPRYPYSTHDNDATNERRQPPILTSATRVDLIDLVGENVFASFEKQKYLLSEFDASLPRRRNNLDSSSFPAADEFEVTTSIVVDTSRGVLHMSISATSIRENPYAIPDTIRFHHPKPGSYSKTSTDTATESKGSSASSATIASDGTILLNSVPFYQLEQRKRSKIRQPRRLDLVRDCYDIYMNNPALDTDLEISEILVSRPDQMSVEFDPGRLLLPPDLVVLRTPPTHSIREWSDDGQMFLPADSVDNYVATVCTTPDGVDKDPVAGSQLNEISKWIDANNPEQSLGYLQIRTDAETLFIYLERFTQEDETSLYAQMKPTTVTNASWTSSREQSTSLLKAIPDELNLRLISSASRTTAFNITLQNKSPVPIRVMRVGLTIDAQNDREVIEDVKSLGLEFNVTKGDWDYSGEIGAAGSVENAILVKCQTNPIVSSMRSFHFTGSIIVRGTMDTELQYDDWKEEMMQNPYRDSHLTIEIPYSMSVLNGGVELTLERSTHPYPQIFGAQAWDRSGRAISTLFFPLTRFDSLDDSEAPLPTQKYMTSREIGHDLRIMSNMALSLSFESAEIVDENGLAVEGTRSPCSRLNVSRVKPFETSIDYPDFEDLGFLSLQYKFDQQEERQRRTSRQREDKRFLPITCFLKIVTTSGDTGIHKVPLILFPGELEITSPVRLGKRQFATNVDKDTTLRRKKQKTVTVGFERLLDWLRISVVGQSFLENLEFTLERKKRSVSQLLFKYLQNMLGLSDQAEVKPILLKIGAIEHGEIVKVPLAFTNHNPIPLILSMDVDKVEGMAIELAKDHSRGNGDGSNIFDFLPNSNGANANSNQAIISEGHFQGHPVYGLRQFLLSSPYASDFSGLFSFRDAVSLSKEAVGSHPFLENLYQWHSYAQFHQNNQWETELKTESRICDLSTYPPSYTSDKLLNAQHYSGPMIVSADKSLVRPLQSCSNQNSNAPKVMIPPGGSARFDVRVRSPPLEFLSSDISQVLATGLVISTTFGQTLPIFATFEALQGQLDLRKPKIIDEVLTKHSDIPSSEEDILRVPLDLHWRLPVVDDYSSHSESVSHDGALQNPDLRHFDSGIPLHVSSTFSRRVRLLEVESCNPWFHVSLQNSSDGIDIAMDTGTYIGSLHSAASCFPHGGISPGYPSFYQCVLNWLSKRHELQPTGCGSALLPSKKRKGAESGIDIPRGLRDIFQAFEKIAISDFRASLDPNSAVIDHAFQLQPRGTSAIKSGVKRSDGYIGLSSLSTYAEAWDAWQAADQMGLTRLSSNLRATIEYYPTTSRITGGNDTMEHQIISLSMHDLGIQTTLSAPRLFVKSSEVDSMKNPAILHFPATLVGSVVSMKIPLKNPTSVPVRVRLAAVSLPTESETQSAKRTLVDRFMGGLESPYVQSGSGHNDEENSNQQWWEGGGAFFLADERGDVIRSNHNISIRAGAGAHVSLVNPSLQSVSAFVLGCGGRYGVRDEMKASEGTLDMKRFSIIGAAAAASITLVGRQRSPLPQLNDLTSDEPLIYAGGIPVPGNTGPQAFAIPFSSLDEIILPPFGTGEIGPILFRPPGRSLALGCDTVKFSDSGYWGVEFGNLCQSTSFSSMVFLENSLTGIERVQLKGESVWDNLYFLDPPGRDDGDAFGDIELRNGRSTLVFDGSGDVSPNGAEWWKVTPVIKQVLLHNGGDVPLVIKSIYLSDTHKLAGKSWKELRLSREACRSGSFRLLDCWESERRIYNVDGIPVENLHVGFELRPGESRSMYMEHSADCRKREEFVAINVDFVGKERRASQDRTLDLQMSYDIRTEGLTGSSEPLHTKKLELMVGYSMDPLQFTDCLPVNFWHGDFIIVEVSPQATPGVNRTRQRKVARGRYRGHRHLFTKILQLFAFASLVGMLSTMTAKLGQVRRQSFERAISRTRHSHRDDMKEMKVGAEKKRPSQQSLWNATFRCLARADPTSPELQTLGREQIKQVVAGRYRAKGGSPPSSLLTSGVFIRERLGAVPPGGNSRQRVGKEGGGTERVRTLSDALFRTFSSEHADSVRNMIPAGLGWRVAFASGIINDKSINYSAFTKTSDLLLERRSRGSVSDQTPEVEEGYGSDSESFEIDKKAVIETTEKRDDVVDTSLQQTEKALRDLNVSDEIAVKEGIGADTVAHINQLKRNEKSQKQPSRCGDSIPNLDSKRIDQIKPVGEARSPASPITSVNSSESSTNEIKMAARNERSGLQSSKDSLGVTRLSTVITHPVGEKSDLHTRQKLVASLKQQDGDSAQKKTRMSLELNSETVTQGTDEETYSKAEVSRGVKAPRIKREFNVSDKNRGTDALNQLMLPPGVCPPPGLAPPPGFNHSAIHGVLPSSSFEMPLSTIPGTAEATLLEDMLSTTPSNLRSASCSPALPFPRQVNTDLFFGGNISEDTLGTPMADAGGLGFRMTSSPPIGQHEDQQAAIGDPLLDVLFSDRDSSRNGFDVMDFLDSILDDGGPTEQGGEQTLSPSALLGGSAGGLLASNPWATEHKSRASAYGIAFDDCDGGDETNPGPIPLLTPAAILLAGQEEDGDDDERAFSFYARLTDEE